MCAFLADGNNLQRTSAATATIKYLTKEYRDIVHRRFSSHQWLQARANTRFLPPTVAAYEVIGCSPATSHLMGLMQLAFTHAPLPLLGQSIALKWAKGPPLAGGVMPMEALVELVGESLAMIGCTAEGVVTWVDAEVGLSAPSGFTPTACAARSVIHRTQGHHQWKKFANADAMARMPNSQWHRSSCLAAAPARHS